VCSERREGGKRMDTLAGGRQATPGENEGRDGLTERDKEWKGIGIEVNIRPEQGRKEDAGIDIPF
jgi:hypothetical protein